jgi:hypothetical protein
MVPGVQAHYAFEGWKTNEARKSGTPQLARIAARWDRGWLQPEAHRNDATISSLSEFR